MIDRMTALWRDITSSLWALPLLMVMGAVALALGAVQIDLGTTETSVWYLYSGSQSDAAQFLSDLVAAIITMATLAISITMVVLTLAAQQLGPRLIRSFMGDLRTQLSLGLMVATDVYLILVLRSVYASRGEVPNLAVTGGTVLVLINLMALLVFVHHLARSIIADNVIAQVGTALDAEIVRLLPEKQADTDSTEFEFPEDRTAPVAVGRSGYLQSIDHEGLVRVAVKAGEGDGDETKNKAEARAKPRIKLLFHAGDHIVEGAAIALLEPTEAANPTTVDAINGCIVLGSEQNSVQDVTFYMHQLIEVALRALSPSISDPFTAIAVIDRLAGALRKIMQRGKPQTVWCDKDQCPRLIMPHFGFETLADDALSQVVHASADSPSVQLRLIEAMSQLAEQATPKQKQVLLRHARTVLEDLEKSADTRAGYERAKRQFETMRGDG